MIALLLLVFLGGCITVHKTESMDDILNRQDRFIYEYHMISDNNGGYHIIQRHPKILEKYQGHNKGLNRE